MVKEPKMNTDTDESGAATSPPRRFQKLLDIASFATSLLRRSAFSEAFKSKHSRLNRCSIFCACRENHQIRFQVDEMRDINIIEWNKKRKLQGFQLDLLRPTHKCRVESFSSEDESMIDESPILECANNHTVNSRTDATFLDDRSEPESAKDSNSFVEDSDTSMSVNDDAKLETDCANTYLCVDRLSYSEDETFIDSKYNPSYDDPDTQAMESPEQDLLIYSEYVKDSNGDQSVDKEFEDFLFSNGVSPNKFVLSSGKLILNQEAESSERPPTIDQEFEEYFSALML